MLALTPPLCLNCEPLWAASAPLPLATPSRSSHSSLSLYSFDELHLHDILYITLCLCELLVKKNCYPLNKYFSEKKFREILHRDLYDLCTWRRGWEWSSVNYLTLFKCSSFSRFLQFFCLIHCVNIPMLLLGGKILYYFLQHLEGIQKKPKFGGCWYGVRSRAEKTCTFIEVRHDYRSLMAVCDSDSSDSLTAICDIITVTRSWKSQFKGHSIITPSLGS